MYFILIATLCVSSAFGQFDDWTNQRRPIQGFNPSKPLNFRSPSTDPSSPNYNPFYNPHTNEALKKLAIAAPAGIELTPMVPASIDRADWSPSPNSWAEKAPMAKGDWMSAPMGGEKWEAPKPTRESWHGAAPMNFNWNNAQRLPEVETNVLWNKQPNMDNPLWALNMAPARTGWSPQPRAFSTGVHGPRDFALTNINGESKFQYTANGPKPMDSSFREETRTADGTVMGSYGFIDETGKKRIIRYTAGIGGFRATGDIYAI